MTLPGSFLFLDESGDPGRGPGGSLALVVAVLHLEAEAPLSRVIKRVRLRARRGRTEKRRPHSGEMKWSLSPPEVREAVLRELVRESALVAGISAGFSMKREGGPWGPDLYGSVAMAALESGRVLGETPSSNDLSGPGKRVWLTVDGGPRFLRSFFSWLTPPRFPRITLRARDSARVPELQVADFVTGAIAAAAVQGEACYLEILQKGGIPVEVKEVGSS
ncbi:MAG: DUF3800 domain-containing protein [Acidobacteria bacterium]|nr:DUF3800 domain-containing protein [Acidobacteriota bacterium]